MAKDINLLPDISLAEEKELRLKKLLTLVSVSAMLISIVGIIAVFGIQIYFQRELNSITEQNNIKRENVRKFTQIELDYRALKSKLSAISTIRKDAINHEAYLTKLTDVLPDGIEITSVQMSEQLMTSINGKAENSENINKFITNLLNESTKRDGYFSDVSLDSIALDQEGNFQFRISMSAKKI